MKTQKPDEWLKKSLHDLRVPATEDEWKGIASSLDASVPPADQFLKTHLSSIETPVAADEWASIAAALDTAAPASGSFFGSRRMLIALSAIVLIGLFWLFYPGENTTPLASKETPVKSGDVPAAIHEQPAEKANTNPAPVSADKPASGSAPANNSVSPAPAAPESIIDNPNQQAKAGEENNQRKYAKAEQQRPVQQRRSARKSAEMLPAAVSTAQGSIPVSIAEKKAAETPKEAKGEASQAEQANSMPPAETQNPAAVNPEKQEAESTAVPPSEKTAAPIVNNEKTAEQATEELAEKTDKGIEEPGKTAIAAADSSAEAAKNNIPPVLPLPKKSGLLLGFSFSPEWAYRNWEPNAEFGNKTHKEYKDLRNSQEKPRLSYSLSFQAEYRFAKGFMVQSGLIYSQKGFSTRYDYKINQVPVVDANTGIILGYLSKVDTQGTRYSGGQSYTYLELPLVAGYQFKLSDKISLQIKAGGSLQYLVGSSGKTIDPATLDLVEISGQKSFKQRNFGYMFSAGVSYTILPRLQLIAEPVYRRTAQPVTVSGNNYSQSFYSVGMNLGVMYKLF